MHFRFLLAKDFDLKAGDITHKSLLAGENDKVLISVFG
jgi:hypothetical protein